MKPSVFIVDDHELFRAGVRAELAEHVEVAGDAASVEEAVPAILHGDRADRARTVQPAPHGGHGEQQLERRKPGGEPQRGKAGFGDHRSSVFPALCSAARLPSCGGM